MVPESTTGQPVFLKPNKPVHPNFASFQAVTTLPLRTTVDRRQSVRAATSCFPKLSSRSPSNRKALISKMYRRSMEHAGSSSVPLACMVCRERHVKCDGRQPSCSRCIDSKQNCFYVKSRRGRRPSRRRDFSQDSSDSTSTSRRGSTLDLAMEADVATMAASPHGILPYDQSITGKGLQPGSWNTSGYHDFRGSTIPPSLSLSRLTGPTSLTEGPPSSAFLQDCYYFYFHANHPVLLPEVYLGHKSQFSASLLIQAAVSYIGSQYCDATRNDVQYLQSLQDFLCDPNSERTKFNVQALLLLSISQRAQGQNEVAAETLDEAITLAVQLGMNRIEFARDNSEGSPVVQEMWRRVWWELYINEATLAELLQKTFFRMGSIESNVELPWEEVEYQSGSTGIAQPAGEISNFNFGQGDTVLSSFSFRISAARMIGQLLKLNQSYYPDSAQLMESLDIGLSNWLLHLPDSKKACIHTDGTVDKLMVQAHLMLNSAIINLHRPRSGLVFLSVQDTSTAIPPPELLTTEKNAAHTAKAIQASDRINNLTNLLGDTIQYSPLLICAMTLSTVVHLSAYVLSGDISRSALIRDRVSLSIGALKGLEHTWPLAEADLRNLTITTRKVMTPAHQQGTAGPSLGSLDAAGYDWVSQMQHPLFQQMPDLMSEETGSDTMGMDMTSNEYASRS